MRQYIRYIGLVVLCTGIVFVPDIRAQTDSLRSHMREVISGDSLANEPLPATYARPQYAFAPMHVQRVRRRIRDIGRWQQQTQVVVAPRVIFVPYSIAPDRSGNPPATSGPQGQPPVSSAPPPDTTTSRIPDASYREFVRYNSFVTPGRQANGPPVRHRRDELARADSTIRWENLPENTVGLPITPRRIEQAFLETGLFRAVGINFETDKAQILPGFRATVDAVGQVLEKHPSMRVEIAGHTDATGPADYNERLSLRRAQAVRTYLRERFAIEPGRLEARGYGESQPLEPNSTPTGRAINRRVSFRILNPEGAEHILETEPRTRLHMSHPNTLSARRLEKVIQTAVRQGVRRETIPAGPSGR